MELLLRHGANLLKEPFQNLIYRPQRRVLCEMFLNFGDDLPLGLGILHVFVTMSPLPTRMQRIPRRAQIGTRFGIVSVFSKAVTNSDLRIPNRLEKVD